jgi:hypothetical protein
MEEILEEDPFILLTTGGNVNLSLFNSSGGNGSDEGDLGEFYVPYSLRPETYIIPVLFAVIFLIGVLGNGTLIVIFLKHR